MIRTVRNAATAAALATAALLSIPATASADAQDQGRGSVTFNCDHCQIADGGIYNAGRDNIVGDGAREPSGPGAPAPTTLVTVTNFSRYDLFRFPLGGGGGYPDVLFPKLAYRFRVEAPSEALYVDPERALARVRIVVDQSGDVSCSGVDVVCEAFRSHDGFVLAIS